MNIFLANDDGIYSPGLNKLAQALSKEHTVCVIAPERQRSAASHSMSVTLPLIPMKASGFDFLDGRAYYIDGTPVDCVKMGLFSGLFDMTFDMVVSGINIGQNLGSDTIYSGTVSVAMEGALHGVRSVAFSIDSYSPKHFDDAAEASAKIISSKYIKGIDSGIALNINYPDVPKEDYAGIVACPLGKMTYIDEVVASRHMRGFDYYWLSGKPDRSGALAGTDVEYNGKGYVTVSPLRPDLTATDKLEMCSNIVSGITL